MQITAWPWKHWHMGEGEQKDGVIRSLDTAVLDLLESVMKPHLKSSAEDSNNWTNSKTELFFKTLQLMLTCTVLKMLDEPVTASFKAITVSNFKETSKGICINVWIIFYPSMPRPGFRALCCSSAADATTHPWVLSGMQGMQPSALVQAQVYHEP